MFVFDGIYMSCMVSNVGKPRRATSWLSLFLVGSSARLIVHSVLVHVHDSDALKGCRSVCSIPRRLSGKFSFSCLGRWLACIPQRLVVALLSKVPAQVQFTAYCFPGISGHVGLGGQASSAGLGSGHDRGLMFDL